MVIKQVLRMLLMVALVVSGESVGADLQQGKVKANACAVCHGQNGIASHPEAPNLAGQPVIYLTQQLKNYKAGRRVNEIMSVIAKPLSEQDIDDLALWYSSMQVEVKIPN